MDDFTMLQIGGLLVITLIGGAGAIANLGMVKKWSRDKKPQKWIYAMDPETEPRDEHCAHVRTWKKWYCIEGGHYYNACLDQDHQIESPPANAQVKGNYPDVYHH